MKKIKGLSLFCVITIVFAASLSGQKVDRPGPTGTIIFPEVEGWEKSGLTQYPKAELGYSVTYGSPIGGRVTVYVYNRGFKEIEDGIEGKKVISEIKNARNDIMQAVDLGYYDDAEVIKEDSMVLGGTNGRVSALRMVMKLKIRGQDLTSEIYLFGFQNNFVKFRATRAQEIEGLENKAIVALFTALDKLFAADSELAK